ncbi:MAG: phosphoribosylaminoimidazolesuccinocarboxamide synthase [Proteobacteria bacterium]|nr:phosphoribosylaminoimidazolesuccinocarboxamide synthase [Pseudomonadota bacterium]
MSDALFQSDLESVELIHRGKVRDVYRIDADRLLVVASDRLSAFDVILPDPIPGKGRILTQVSNFWFEKTAHIIDNHILDVPLTDVLTAEEAAQLEGRAVVVRSLNALPIEAVVRGYIIGSGWKEYQASGEVCGIRLPDGLELAGKLPEPIFTPATKAAIGDHDENIAFDKVIELIGVELAEKVRDVTLEIYNFASEHARKRGIIIADTKFEFGTDDNGKLYIIDEMLTPDSSRFWPADTYRPGISPPSFDKQFVRDYLETLDWNKKAPGPRVPEEVRRKTAEKYREAFERLVAEV